METLNYEKLFSLKRIIKVFSRNFAESFSFHLAFEEKVFPSSNRGGTRGELLGTKRREHFSEISNIFRLKKSRFSLEKALISGILKGFLEFAQFSSILTNFSALLSSNSRLLNQKLTQYLRRASFVKLFFTSHSCTICEHPNRMK